jgi:hypothetical protein
MLSQSPCHPGLTAFELFRSIFTGRPLNQRSGLFDFPTPARDKAMAEELATQAWFVRIRTSKAPPALIDFAVGKATLEAAIVAIMHRADLALEDEVTSSSQLTTMEISSFRLRPDEVRTYGRRIYNAGIDRWTLEREPTVPKTNT